MTLMVLLAFSIVSATGAFAAPDMTDSTITDAVKNEMLFDQAVPSTEITVTTVDGIVTLEGTVDSLLDKTRAARIAETVKGVRGVINSVTVEHPEDVQPGELKDAVKDALLMNPATESYEVNVTATDAGEVILSGDVESWQEKQLARNVVAGVDGVTEVTNTIDPDFDIERPDGEIKAEVEETLKWNVLIDSGLIDVKVKNGTVHLSGTVGSAAERTLAHQEAWVSGVDMVKSEKVEVAQWASDPDQRKRENIVKSDENIRDAVEDAMAYDPRVNSFEIDTEVMNGQVTLSGTVNNLKAKRVAEDLARNTVGVNRVVNSIAVDPDEALVSDAIEEDIETSLLMDPYVDRYEIYVDVNDGTANLTGTVDTYFEKQQADDIASSVAGVIDVTNKITVDENDSWYVYDPYVDHYWYSSYPSGAVYGYTYGTSPFMTTTNGASDSEIKKAIRDELWWSPYVNRDNVTVEVYNGVAQLTGEVETWGAYWAATENAFEGGATGVDNDLSVM